MTIDANLIEGIKIGIAIGAMLILPLAVWGGWLCYKRGYEEGIEWSLKRERGDA